MLTPVIINKHPIAAFPGIIFCPERRGKQVGRAAAKKASFFEKYVGS